jgi:glycosyltransferase involved in cell wall biosynthesis
VDDEAMTTAILIPSLNRPQNLEPLLRSIQFATPEDHYVFLMVSDSESIRICRDLGHPYLDDSSNPDKRYVTRNNEMVRHLRPGTKQVFFGSDDIEFSRHWLDEALIVMNRGYDVVVGDDLRNRNGTMALMKVTYFNRAVFDKPGDVFYSEYIHNFADTEQFFTAKVQQTFARAMNSRVEHLNPVFAGARAFPYDDTYALSREGNDHDAELFYSREPLIIEWGTWWAGMHNYATSCLPKGAP